jgi:hypothetical protein
LFQIEEEDDEQKTNQIYEFIWNVVISSETYITLVNKKEKTNKQTIHQLIATYHWRNERKRKRKRRGIKSVLKYTKRKEKPNHKDLSK